MWQAPDLKRRAQLEARRDREKTAKKKEGFRLQRTCAQVRISRTPEPPVILGARVILNDITPEGMHFLANGAMPVGELAQITLEEPRRIYVRARILACEEVTCERRVISVEPLSHRIKVIFVFASEEDDRDFRRFYDELANDVLKTRRK